VANVEPYTEPCPMANQYNKPAKGHWLEVRQHVGLHIYPAKHTADYHTVCILCMIQYVCTSMLLWAVVGADSELLWWSKMACWVFKSKLNHMLRIPQFRQQIVFLTLRLKTLNCFCRCQTAHCDAWHADTCEIWWNYVICFRMTRHMIMHSDVSMQALECWPCTDWSATQLCVYRCSGLKFCGFH